MWAQVNRSWREGRGYTAMQMEELPDIESLPSYKHHTHEAAGP